MWLFDWLQAFLFAECTVSLVASLPVIGFRLGLRTSLLFKRTAGMAAELGSAGN